MLYGTITYFNLYVPIYNVINSHYIDEQKLEENFENDCKIVLCKKLNEICQKFLFNSHLPLNKRKWIIS